MKEWWTAKVGEDEEFDHNSVCIANIDNDKEKSDDKVVIGSFQGKLRIYKPNQQGNHEYHIEDLIIEKDMKYPILQVGYGRFKKNS